MCGGSSTTTQNQSSTYTADPRTQAAVGSVLNYVPSIAGTQYNTGMDQNVQGMNSQQLASIQGLGGLAQNNPASGYINQANQYSQQAADPNSVIAMQQQFYNPMSQQILSQLGNVFGQQDAQLLGNQAATGAIGGSRSAVANSTLANQQGLAAGQTLAGLQQQALNAAQTQQGQIAGQAYQQGNLGQEALGTQLTGLNAGLQGGNQLQQQGQNVLNAAQTNAVQSTLFPQQEAAAAANIAGIGSLLGGTSSGQSQTTTPVNYLGMILGAVGAGTGAYLKSDERVKTDIAPIGTTYDGQHIYKFRYDGDPTTRIGLMAQEVQKKHPDAVRTDGQGIKEVNYDAATKDAAREAPQRLHRDLGGGVGIGSGASGLQGYSGLQNPLQAYQGLQDPLAQATQVQVNPVQPHFPTLNMGQGQKNTAQDAINKQSQQLNQGIQDFGNSSLPGKIADYFSSPASSNGYSAEDAALMSDLDPEGQGFWGNGQARGGAIHRDMGGGIQQELLGARELQALSGAHSPFEAHISQPSTPPALSDTTPPIGSAFGGRIHREEGGATPADSQPQSDWVSSAADWFRDRVRNNLSSPEDRAALAQARGDQNYVPQPLGTPRPLPGPVSQDVIRQQALEAQRAQTPPPASPWDTSVQAAPLAPPPAVPPQQPVAQPASLGPTPPPVASQPASPPQAFPTPAVTAALGSPAQTPPPVGTTPQQSSPLFQAGHPFYTRLENRESSGNPNAQAGTSSAFGPYQITVGKWDDYIRQHPNLGLTPQDRLNPEVQRQHIVPMVQETQKALIRAGIDPTEANTQMAWTLGDTGAVRFKGALDANPKTPAETIVGHKAAEDNHNIFYHEDGTPKTVGEVYANFNARPDATNRAPQQSPGQAALQDPSLQPPKPGDSYTDRILNSLGMGDVSKRQDFGDKLMNMGFGMMAAGPSVGVKGPAGAAISALNAAGKGGMYMNQQAQEQQKLDQQQKLQAAQIKNYEREATKPQKIGTETIYDQFGMPHYRDRMGIPDPSAPDGWREVKTSGGSGDASHPAGAELPATMEALQKSVSPSIWNEANAIADYDRAPYIGRYGAPGTPGGKVMETARLINNLRGDEYNEAIYHSKQAAQKDLSATVTSRQITSGNSGMGHLYDLVKSVDKRDPGDYPIFNRIGAMRREAAGADVTKSYNENASLLAGELTSFYRAMGGAEQDIQRELKNLDPNLSLEQQRGVIGKAVSLVRSKLDALEAKRDFAFGKNGEKKFPILNDKAKKQFDAVEEWAARNPEDRSPVRDFKTTAPTPAKAPPVGHIEGGYRFKGGDPGDKANWEKV